MSTTIDESYIPDMDYGDFDGEGGGRRTIFIILVAVLVLAIGALAYWRLAVYKPGKQTLAAIEKTTDTYSLGQQTMNLSDGSLVQVEVVMQLTTLADKAEIAKASTKLANAEIFVFGSTSSQELLTASGKSQVQHELVAQIQQILGPVNKLPQVQGVLFKQLVVPTPSPGGAAAPVGGSTLG